MSRRMNGVLVFLMIAAALSAGVHPALAEPDGPGTVTAGAAAPNFQAKALSGPEVDLYDLSSKRRLSS